MIYNAVDPLEFGPQVREGRDATRARLGIAASDVAFLLLGSGYARKGVPAALRSLARLPENARLVVVGRDKNPSQYKALARRLDVAARVSFAGPQADPRPYLGAADAFVLPTLYDPLSNAVLEALACGLPVVTSRRCGAGELVVAHDAGVVCDATDVAAIAEGMRRLLDPAQRLSMAARATAAVATLTPDAMAGELIGLYREMLGQPCAIIRGRSQCREFPCAATCGAGKKVRQVPARLSPIPCAALPATGATIAARAKRFRR